ncbi:nitrogenase component 1 [Clostridium sp. UBA4395]|uniref:nitrogenase component 1 n=1 Tax=Clostridium sp. UBA4395 TaxID=1946360 RepID=UPI0032167920
MNQLKHLKKIASIKSNAGVKFLTPAAFPGSHCPLHTALALSVNIKGMSTLVVGTSECSTYSRGVVKKAKYSEEVLHWMYVLDSNEVVFGCREGVINAIKQMDREGAGAIMVILTCVPEVIGEDIEGIIHEVQPHVKARLSSVLMGHFRCNSHPSGYWKTLLAFGVMMEKRVSNPNIINILGRSIDEDHIPMPELLVELEKKGLQLRMLALKSDIKDFMEATDGKLNLVISPDMNPLADMMEKEYEIPYISLHEIYDICEIDQAYRKVEKILNISFDNRFEELREKTLIVAKEAEKKLEGLKYISTGMNPMPPLSLTFYLNKFNMKPILLHMEEFYPDDRLWAKKLKEIEINPFICHMVNNKSDVQVLEKLDADLSFGEIFEGTGKIPCVSYLYEIYGQIGYERTSLLLNRIMNTLENHKI